MAKQPVVDDSDFEPDDSDFQPDEPSNDIKVPQSNWMKNTWDWANKTVLPDAYNPSMRVARENAEPSAQSTPEDWKIPFTGGATWRGLGQGMNQGAADVVTGLATPLNLATTAATMGSGSAIKAGLPTVGKAVGYGARALSAPVAAHGGMEVLRPDATLSERGFGLAELAGGVAGMNTPVRPKPGLQKVGQAGMLMKEPALPTLVAEGKVVKTGNEMPVTKGTPESVISAAIEAKTGQPSVITIKGQSPETVKQLKAEGYKPAGISSEGYPIMKKSADPNLNQGMGDPELAGSEPSVHQVDPVTEPVVDPDVAALEEMTNRLEGETSGMEVLNDEGDIQSTTQNNGSGDSGGASQERINANFSMKGKGEQRVKFDRGGKETPLTDVGAVDYQPQKGETTAIRHADGTIEIVNDNGGKPPSNVPAKSKVGRVRQRLNELYDKDQAGTLTGEELKEAQKLTKHLNDDLAKHNDAENIFPEDTAAYHKAKNEAAAELRKNGYDVSSDGVVTKKPDVSVSERMAQTELERQMGGKRNLDKVKLDNILEELETIIGGKKKEIPSGGLPKVGEGIANEMPESFQALSGELTPEQTSFPSSKNTDIKNILEKKFSNKKKSPQQILNEEALAARRKPVLDFETENISTPTITAAEVKATIPVEKIPAKIKEVNDKAKAAKMAPPEVRPGIVQQLEDAQREILTGLDVSFIGRQGRGLMTHKGYWTAFDDMFKAFGSRKASQLVNDSITSHKSGLFKETFDADGNSVKPYAERVGLKLADFYGTTEETMRSSFVEKGKYNPFAATARANKAFINKARSDVFADLIGELKRRGIDPETDLVLGKQIANSVNVSSGKGNMGKLAHPTMNLDTGVMERSAAMGLLNKVFFAPEFAVSRVQTFNRVLNPITGAINPFNSMDRTLRIEAIRSLMGIVGTGLLIQEMARQAGAIVLNDPTSPDFRKIKIGNSRIDNFAGLGQYGVGTAQFLMGQKTSSNTNRTTNLVGGFGSGNPRKYGAKSSFDLASDFAVNRAAPIPSLIISWMRGKDFDGKPFEWKKAIADRVAPLVLQDMYDIAADDPSLIPLGILPIMGEGIQTYGR